MTPSTPTPTERAAREEISGAYGRTLTDAEWGEMRRNLLTVFAVLVEWQTSGEAGDTRALGALNAVK
jgi:hypothetical protein